MTMHSDEQIETAIRSLARDVANPLMGCVHKIKNGLCGRPDPEHCPILLHDLGSLRAIAALATELDVEPINDVLLWRYSKLLDTLCRLTEKNILPDHDEVVITNSLFDEEGEDEDEDDEDT